MNKGIFLIAATALLVSGCSVAGKSGTTTPTTPTKPVAGGPGTSSYTASEVLSAYTQTFAESDTDKLEDAIAKGIEGFGVAGAGSAPVTAATASNFRTATIKKDGDTLTIKVEGDVITLKKFEEGTFQVGKQTYDAYGFTTDGARIVKDTTGDFGLHLQGSYAALTGYVKNSNFNSIRHSGEGYSILVSGLETNSINLPKEEATYAGVWYLVANEGSGGGEFTAVADFSNGRLLWSAFNDPYSQFKSGDGRATITGNSFTGHTILTDGAYNGSAVIAGKFYGVGAEEIAGVISGNVGNEKVGGGFIGNR